MWLAMAHRHPRENAIGIKGDVEARRIGKSGLPAQFRLWGARIFRQRSRDVENTGRTARRALAWSDQCRRSSYAKSVFPVRCQG
jgi:hypothetical protein